MKAPIVIKVGGAAVDAPATAPLLFSAVADLAARRPVVLVHGGGAAVDRHLERLGFTTERREGIRITPVEQIDEVAAVLAGRVNKSIVGRLTACGARPVGLCLGDGRAVPTVKSTRHSFDPGQVGEVAAVEGGPNLLALLVREGYLPVLSSIGIDAATGKLLNVNADDAAAGVAAVIGAEALVLLTDVPGVLDANKKVIPELTPAAIERLVASGAISGGMIVKARAAAATATRTRRPVIILSGNDAGSLAEWAAGRPQGTRIIPE